MGKIFHIGEHTVEVPEAPTRPLKIPALFGDGKKHTIPLSELILNSDKPLGEQAWTREELPKFFTHYLPDDGNGTGTVLFAEETVWDGNFLESLSEEDSNRLVYLFDREIHRRTHGVHFKNFGETVYLTGHYYAFLQWIKPYGLTAKMLPPWRDPTYEYAEYMEYQRDVFYVIDKVNVDPDILGLFIAKAKKTGITQILAAYYLNKGTLSRMSMLGIMSIGDTARSVNMQMIIYAYDNLPPIFQPNLRDRADKTGDIYFGEPGLKNVRTKAGKQRRLKLLDSKPLNTRIWAAKAKAAGFDAPLISDAWFDELCKYDTENKQSPETVFTRNQETVKVQDIFNGRIWITFYPPEEDTEGFFETRKIWFDSKLSTIKPGGKRTVSGLITLYISALVSYRSSINRYGKCDMADAHRRNQETWDLVRNDPRQLQAKMRQYSETEQQCWSISGAGSTFNNVRLGVIKANIEEKMQTTRLFTPGRLDWSVSLWEAGAKNKRPLKTFAPANFIELTTEQIMSGEDMEGPNGRLWIYQKIKDINAPLKMGRDDLGNLLPLPFFHNYGACDPTEYAASSEVIQGSKNANYTMNRPDLVLDSQYQRIASNIILSEYLYRPDNPQEYYEDTVKEIIFFGKRVIVEANKAWVATKLIQDGLGYYMIVINEETDRLEPWHPKMKYKLFRVGPGANTELETIVRAISTFFIEPTQEGAKDYGKAVEAHRLIDQLMRFSKDRSKFFDLAMCFGECLICGEAIMTLPIEDNFSHLYTPATIARVFSAFG